MPQVNYRKTAEALPSQLGNAPETRSSFPFLQAPLRQHLESVLRQGSSLGVIRIHLAGFALFGKLYGNALSDTILEKLQAILHKVCPELLPADAFYFVERVESSAFMVLFHNGHQTLDSLLDLALRFRFSVRSHLNQEVVQITGQSLGVQAGYALLPPNTGKDLEDLLYAGLGDAREVAAGHLDLSRLSLMHEFREVVEAPLVRAVYQPIVDLRTGEVLGWESLARGPEGSHFRSPGMLFDFAEEVGSIFTLERVCRQQALAGLEGLLPGQKLFLNIHPQTLGDPSFRPGETRQLLDEHGLRPHNLVFEITERHPIKDFTLFHRTLDHYRSQGFLVAIDDVGTGYSGLTSLAGVRPDFIKVDMGLIRGIDANPVQRALLETLVTFADKIGSAIVAEGIETETELSSLLAMGVHYGQGFYLARPANPKPIPVIPSCLRNFLRGRGQAEWMCSIPVRGLAEPVPQVPPDARTREVKQMLDSQLISGVVVVDRGRPLGLVMSHSLDRQLGNYYGTALYWERSVSRLMDPAPLIVEGSTPVEQVAKTAMNRERFKIYDHIIITENGYLRGIVSVQKMLDALAQVQVEMAKGASPLTGLPGNVALEQEIDRRCVSNEPASFIYVDLDHFKVYNDTYGFEAGDKMILMTSRILSWAIKRHGTPQDSLAHVGGDDFVLICDPARSERICQGVVRCFKRMVRACYRPEDRLRGWVEGKDRQGQSAHFPLVSVSLGIVDCRGVCDQGQIGRRAAEVKRYAKSIPGCVYVRDRRAPLGQEEKPGLTAPESVEACQLMQ